jgi:hypothetical protein
VLWRGTWATAPAAFTNLCSRSFCPIAPLVESLFDAREDEPVEFVEVRETFSYGARLIGGGVLHLGHEPMKCRPPAETEANNLREEIGGEDVVIASIAGFSDAFGDAAIEKATRLGAYAGFADAELLGEGVEGERIALEEERGEDSSSDAGQAVTFGGEPHALDEGVAFVHSGGTGVSKRREWTVSFIQYKLNDEAWPALCTALA